jgi:uncharacterized protein YecT (DUF1311 family)
MFSLPPIALRLRGWKLTDRVAAAFLLFSLAPIARSQEKPNNPPALCEPYLSLAVPASDLPTADERKQLAKCSSYNLYFGVAGPQDLVKARKCAYIERERTKENYELFAGAGLLTMIYANGQGTTRNFDLALKFSCEYEGADAENGYRFKHLLELQQQNWTGNNFSLCDDATSGFMMGWCSRIDEDLQQEKRVRELRSVTTKWKPEELRAFDTLQRIADKFFLASSENEVDLRGTARAAFEIEAEASLRDGFVTALKRFETGNLPSYRSVEFQKADSELNSVYSKIQTVSGKEMDFTTVTPEGIKSAQWAWLRCRDAWVTFGSIKYPSVPPESWKTWLTLDRIKMLKEWLPDGT